jgi:hypothetical protein
MPNAFLCVAIVLALIGMAQREVQVSDSEIRAENAYFKSLGVTLSEGGVVLKKPYTAPYSNRSFIVPRSWLDNDPLSVKASDLRSDLPTLRFLMEKTYPGWQIAAKHGWNWDKWFDAWDRELSVMGDATIASRQAFSPWDALRAFMLDNHSHPMVLGTSGETLSGRLTEFPMQPCTELIASSGKYVTLDPTDLGQQPHQVYSWDGGSFTRAAYVAYPSHIGATASIKCGRQVIKIEMTAQPVLKPSRTYYRDLGDGIGYVKAPGAFSYHRNEELRSALSSDTRVDKQRAILLDLRGNGGGASPDDILTHWFSKADLDKVVRPGTYFNMHSCFAVGLQFNLGQEFLFHGLKAPLPSETKAIVQNMMQAIGTTPPDACKVRTTTNVSQTTMLDHHFSIRTPANQQTRIIAIVDNECGSDCEGFVTTLAQLPGTVIAGTNTSGTIGFLQPGMFVLPYSKMPFMLAQSYSDVYGDRRSQAGYGLSVDVLLSSEASQQISSLKALALALSHEF